MFQLCKLLPEASNCCRKHTQIFRFKFNQIPGRWDLFKCQQPPSLPAYFRLLYISKCFLFHRNSKSNLGAHMAQKSQIKMFPACPTNQLIKPCSPHGNGSGDLWGIKAKIPFVYRGDAWLQGVVLRRTRCCSVPPCLASAPPRAQHFQLSQLPVPILHSVSSWIPHFLKESSSRTQAPNFKTAVSI